MNARFRGALLAATTWVAAFELGCSVPSSFTCSSHTQCGGGVCVIGGCAFSSEDCDSGLRYGEFAPTHLAGTCVPVNGVASGESGSETQAMGESETGDESNASATVGDGDGDSTTSGDGDGDGDSTTSGDGDGDGDGDTTTSGDSDDVTTSGDGDGDDGSLPIPDTAIAHYTFDEINGATVVDATGNGYDATLDNNQPQVPGVVNQGLDFSNLDRVIVPPEVLAGEGAFTVEFYMQISQAQGPREFPFYYGSLDGTPTTLSAYVEYTFPPTGTFRFAWSDGQALGPIGTSNIDVNQWHHVAVTVGQSGMQLYVDHFLDDDHPFNPSPGLPGYAWIQLGGTPSGFGSFIGVMDEVRFSAGVLSTNEMMPPP